jgi:hypothetical protein
MKMTGPDAERSISVRLAESSESATTVLEAGGLSESRHSHDCYKGNKESVETVQEQVPALAAKAPANSCRFILGNLNR